MFRLLSLLVIGVLISGSLYAQKIWVSGTFVEKETQETLPGVKIYQENKLLTTTDANGVFTIALEKGVHHLFAKHFSSRTVFQLEIKETGEYNLGTIPIDMEDEGAGFRKTFALSKSSKYYDSDQ